MELSSALEAGGWRDYIVITKRTQGPGMKTRIVRIGNSHGIRIPKPILEASGLGEEVVLEVREGSLIVRAAGRPRADWDEAFRAMAEAGDDRLLDAEVTPTSTWDEDEWEW
jgi:antitoxin MazE